jgi:PhnB protein
MPNVKPIPDGYNSVTPYLIISNRRANEALDFYARAFGTKEILRMPRPDGGVMHAEIRLGDSVIMLADESEKTEAFGPKHYGGSPISLHVYVPDVDGTTKQAEAAGAEIIRPVADQFYGDRTSGLRDPFGHRWYLATHVRDVSMEELQQQMNAIASA